MLWRSDPLACALMSDAITEAPASAQDNAPTQKLYGPYSIDVLALLASASVFGALLRIGLSALANYDGSNIFPLAYSQALGCFIMGFILSLKQPIGDLCVFVFFDHTSLIRHSYAPLYTALTTGKSLI